MRHKLVALWAQISRISRGSLLQDQREFTAKYDRHGNRRSRAARGMRPSSPITGAGMDL